MTELTYKEIASRWRCSIRTVHRIKTEFELEPADIRGTTAVFRLADVERVERARKQKRLAEIRGNRRSRGIISIREAKRLARRGRAK